MRRMTKILAAVALAATLLAGCGGGGGSAGGGNAGGEERTVLVDFRHDEFAAAFLQYYPEHLEVRPGDTVQFRQAWTGEPHSVTFGKIVDDFIDLFPQVAQYDGIEEARAGGVAADVLSSVADAYEKLPAMTGESFETVPSGAEPCYVADIDDAPLVRDIETDVIDPDSTCPKGGKVQPAFTGRQALYNSGFIPYSGAKGNSFTVPIAEDATPGTYRYFCNYHFIFMSGDVQVVEPGKSIPSQAEVSKQARTEIQADADKALPKVEAAKTIKQGAKIDEVTLPLAGRAIDEETPVIINEFLPKQVSSKVGQKVTWTFDGAVHTVSFNVPKYFPIFTVAKSGRVTWDPKAHEPVGFALPKQETNRQEERPPPVAADAGTWDGRGGFHSSGALNPGDTFSVTFTRPGTYSYACVLHPQMVGTLEVRS